VAEDKLWLIDHEMCFPIQTDKYLKDFDKGIWNYPSYNHLFYHVLKANRSVHKYSVFDEFEEYLKYLNLNELEFIRNFLEQNDVVIPNYHLILNHIRILQSNSSLFTQILRKGIL